MITDAYGNFASVNNVAPGTYTLDVYRNGLIATQFQNPVMKISVTPLHKIYNSILI
jgi:hypothetical protein